MKKVILSVVILFILQLSFAQELIKLDYSDFISSQTKTNNSFKDFKNLATSAQVGVAYLEKNNTKVFNKENGIKLIRVNSNNLQELNTSLNFSNTVEMIIIQILEPDLNLKSIDCFKFKSYKNLKYIYYIYQIDMKNDIELKKINCLPSGVKQYYTKQLAS